MILSTLGGLLGPVNNKYSAAFLPDISATCAGFSLGAFGHASDDGRLPQLAKNRCKNISGNLLSIDTGAC